jgi:hypothetical protein
VDEKLCTDALRLGAARLDRALFDAFASREKMLHANAVRCGQWVVCAARSHTVVTSSGRNGVAVRDDLVM